MGSNVLSTEVTPVLESGNKRLEQRKFAGAWFSALIALAGLMALRNPSAIFHPQLWAEDGTVFLVENETRGAGAILHAYNGYLHLLPRIIAWLAGHADPARIPGLYNGAAFLVWLFVLARTLSPRIDLPRKAWLAVAFLIVPHDSGEVFFNITNLQWVMSFLFIQQLFMRVPPGRAQAVADSVILAVAGLTGPFSILMLPFFLGRAWLGRKAWEIREAAVVGAAVMVQVIVMATQPAATQTFRDGPFNAMGLLAIIGQRLFVAPFAGRHLAVTLLPSLAAGACVILLLALVLWAIRPSPHRERRCVLVGAMLVILAAGAYRGAPSLADYAFLGSADRYFYDPKVLLDWLLITEISWENWRGWIPLPLLAMLVLINVPRHYAVATPVDLHWSEHCDAIRRGEPASIPTLPEGWTLEYPGRAPRPESSPSK